MNILPLFLNDVDGYEILVIIFVVLIFFGPKSIPGIAKTLGKALFSIRNASSELQNEIRKSGLDIKKDININDILKKEQQEIIQPMDQVFTDINNTIHYQGNDVQNIETTSTENPIPLKSDGQITEKINSDTEENKDV